MEALQISEDQIDRLMSQGCPCFCSARSTCSVACSPLPVSGKCRELFCTSENYDSCALLLAHLLRHSQSAAGRYSSDLRSK